MFQGLRTLIFRVKSEDLPKAKTWYSKLLGKAPYFDELFYVGFNVGGFELGIDPSDDKLVVGNTVNTYMGGANIKEVYAHCLKLGAQVDTEIKNVGGDIYVATIRDPFGNILGLIENPGFQAE